MEVAKDFEAESTKGKIRLSSLLKEKDFVVLYFYPKSFTSGCTEELKRFTELYDEFKKLNAEVIGVSADDLETQKEFAEKYNAKFPLIADTNLEVINLYNAKNPRSEGAKRITYVIDKNMRIISVIKTLKAEEHADEALKVIKEKLKEV
ncbi:MAG: peroxiredoxin [Candidatus Aenigmatarchaeota archaeon]